MLGKIMPLSRIVMILAVVAMVMGIVFIYQGVSKANMITDQMREEAVSTSIYLGNASRPGDIIDSAAEAQEAADTIKGHRRNIAPSYQDLLAGGSYDPANPTHLSYTQALNMENYLYMGVFALGFTQAITVIGIFMIVVGVALIAVWAAIRKKRATKGEEVRST